MIWNTVKRKWAGIHCKLCLHLEFPSLSPMSEHHRVVLCTMILSKSWEMLTLGIGNHWDPQDSLKALPQLPQLFCQAVFFVSLVLPWGLRKCAVCGKPLICLFSHRPCNILVRNARRRGLVMPRVRIRVKQNHTTNKYIYIQYYNNLHNSSMCCCYCNKCVCVCASKNGCVWSCLSIPLNWDNQHWGCFEFNAGIFHAW